MEEEEPENINSDKVLATPSYTSRTRRFVPRAPRKRLEAWIKRENKREERRRRDIMVDTDSDSEKSQTPSEKRRMKQDVADLKTSMDIITKQLALLVSMSPGSNTGALVATSAATGTNTGSAIIHTGGANNNPI